MKAIKKLLLFLLPILFVAFGLILLLLDFYKNGRMILGSEGSYYTDFISLFKNYAYAWQPVGVGLYAISINYVFHLSFLQALINNERLVNFLMVYSIYFLPLLAVYLLSLELKLNPWLALLIGLFYITNPFTSNFFKSINQWNMLAAYILPAFLWLILKFYNQNFKLFLFFGLHSILFAFTNANPPTMVIYQIAIAFFVLFISLYKEGEFKFRVIVKKYLLLVLSFFLFNLWWIINWFYILSEVRKTYTKEFAISWLRGAERFVPALWRTINLTSLLEYPTNTRFDFFNQHFNGPLAQLILSIPVFLLIYFLFRKKFGRKHHLFLTTFLLLVAFLSKGVRGIFGRVYEFMVMHFPFFHIFKSAAEKWGLLFVFLLTLYFIFILKDFRKNKFYRLFLVFLIIYVSFCLKPFVTLNFLPDARISKQLTHSKRFLYKTEYQDLRSELNSDPRIYRLLSLPGSLNYQIALWIEGNRFYTGNDPILSNINKPFLAPYNGNYTQRFHLLFDSISEPNYLNLLGFFNIKKIVINKDMYPWFGFREKENIYEIEEILDKTLAASKDEVIDLYDVGEFYLPRFYVPDKVIYSSANRPKSFLGITSLKDFSKRTAIYPEREKIFDRPIGEADFIKENSSEIILVGQIQSTIDEAKLRTGAMGFDPGGVLFPYARWKPGSFIYRLVREKEQKAKRQLDEPKDLFENHLFFAAKRIYEIQKWEGSLKDKHCAEVLGQYKEEMLAAVENLGRLATKHIDTFPLLVQLEVSFGAHKGRLLDVLEGNYGDEEGWEENQRIKMANSIFKEIEQQFKKIIEKHYSKTKYFFEIPEEGEYEILVERHGAPPSLEIQEIIQGKDGEIITPILEAENDENLISFGKRGFSEGSHLLTFVENISDNLLTEEWKRGDSVSLEKEIKLFGKGDMIHQEIQSWQPEMTYEISLKYKVKNGKMRVFLSEEREDKVDARWLERGVIKFLPKTPSLLDTTLESDNEWREFKILINSSRNSKSARFYISNMTNLGVSDVECRDVEVRAVYEPDIILRKLGSSHYTEIPKITFRKINPTKYIVDVEDAINPYFLVFNESFHRGWKAYIQTPNIKHQTDGDEIDSYFNGDIKEKRHENIFLNRNTFETWRETSLLDSKHIIMNDYANSWYITPNNAGGKKDYRIIIEYWPQRLFYLGALVSFLTFFISLLIGAGKIIKFSKRRLNEN